MNGTLMERYLPEYSFGHRYAIDVDSGDIDAVYRIARNVDLARSRVIPVLFRLRGLPTEKLRARDFIAAMGWSGLDECEPTEFLIGYWRGHRIEPVDNLEAFRSLPAHARHKVVFGFHFRKLAPGRVRIETETRVQCLDEDEFRRFRRYWFAIRPFSGLVRKEVLRLIKQEAEACCHGVPEGLRMEMVVRLPWPLMLPLRGYFQLMGRVSPRLAAGTFRRLMAQMPRVPLRDKDHAFLGTMQRLSFDCGDAALAGYALGSGPTVLLVHGLAGSAANFRVLVPALVAQGYRVVAFDAINHGNSPDGLAFSARTIRHLESILRQLGDLHAIVSHSAGTWLVMMALLDFPPSASLKKCVYLAPYAHVGITLRTFMDYFAIPKPATAALRRWFEEIGGMPFDHQGFRHCLPLHRVPAPGGRLFVHDADDRHVPLDSTRRMLDGDAESRLLVTQGLGHFNILKDDAVVRAVVEFLAEPPPPSS